MMSGINGIVFFKILLPRALGFDTSNCCSTTKATTLLTLGLISTTRGTHCHGCFADSGIEHYTTESLVHTAVTGTWDRRRCIRSFPGDGKECSYSQVGSFVTLCNRRSVFETDLGMT
ncbi:hypothetical protein B0T13DRAFT_211748 [Neurospora crassa]|nr:hypothetical protein B0T13DRAFT_211748 [Neurospora crassa]